MFSRNGSGRWRIQPFVNWLNTDFGDGVAWVPQSSASPDRPAKCGSSWMLASTTNAR
jgi:hypothetical protein